MGENKACNGEFNKMKWKFWEKVKTTDERAKLKRKYGYRVTVCDPMGKSPRELDTFGASKSRGEDGIVWLVNQSKNFSEVFPLDNEYIVTQSYDEIEKDIKYWENYKPRPNENKLNKEEKLQKLYKLKKALIHNDGSFLKIDKDGTPHIMYIRYRTSFIPLKWDLDFSTIHTPVEPLIKNVLTVQKEKAEKYKQNNQGIITWGMVIWGVFLLIWTGGAGYYSLHWFGVIDSSQVKELQERIDMSPLYCAELYGQAGQNFLTASIYAVNLTKTLKEELNPVAKIEVASESIK